MRGTFGRAAAPRRLSALATCVCLLAMSHANATIVRFSTSAGDVDVRLFNGFTPNSVANFLGYVTTDRYEGTFIHRVPQSRSGGSSHFVVQGGGFKLNNDIFAATGIETDDPIADEPGISNIRGTLAFAKNSLGATSQWFFNVGDNSFLDAQNFTVFGRVLGGGMQVVDLIDNLPAINASAAETPNTGEDFDEVPVFDVEKVISQQTIRNDDAVMVNSIRVLDLPAGDYNFDGVVDMADYILWRDSLGSTLDVAADGDGSGMVDAADYGIWKNNFGQSSAAALNASSSSLNVPEPATAVSAIAGLLALVGWRRTTHRP